MKAIVVSKAFHFRSFLYMSLSFYLSVKGCASRAPVMPIRGQKHLLLL